jgi:hypothetical protein
MEIPACWRKRLPSEGRSLGAKRRGRKSYLPLFLIFILILLLIIIS